MSIERKEVGPRMSQIVVHGDTVYLAGVVAQGAKGKSVTEQTKDVLATIDKYLAPGRQPIRASSCRPPSTSPTWASSPR